MPCTVATVNPATGEPLQTYDAAGIDDVLAILEDVHTAQPGWAAVLVEQRADHLRAVGASSASSGTSWPR
jgi:acyl-CoA reductase-like NAD-dependent aldehyde dehydrogenase